MKIFKSKIFKISCVLLALIFLILSTLYIGMLVSKNWSPWRPDYQMVDIDEILDKPTLSSDDYNLLYKQTGLTKLGIDGLLEKDQKSTILEIQKYFFEEQDIYYQDFAPFMGYMRRANNSTVPHAILENGDILFSPSTFLSMIKMGHSTLVINEDTNSLLQATGYGVPSESINAKNIFVRPAFIILRVNADKQTRDQVAKYARENLMGIDYGLLVGVFGDKAPKELTSTHCSHIVWYAYNQFNIDIDGNGGKIVTPHNLTIGENVSVVQIFGIDINEYQNVN